MPKYLGNAFVVLFCVGLIVPLSLRAQKKDLEVYEIFDVSLEDLLNVGIVSASKKKQSVVDAPASAYVFTEQNIKTRGYRSLLDLLKDVPEVEVQQNSDKEFKNLVTIRGVSGNEKFLILLDGIRITPATGDNYTFGTQFSLVNAQRVEVIIGPASALYGVDAFSGIVNIISKTAEGNKLNGGALTTSYGLYNTTDNSFVAGGKVDKMQLSVCGQVYHSSEVDLQNKYTDDFLWYENKYKNEGLVVESDFYNKIQYTSDFERWAGSSFNGASLGRTMEMPTTSYFLSANMELKSLTVGVSRMYEKHSSATGADSRYAVRDREAFIASEQNNIHVQHRYVSFNKKWRLNSTLRMNYYAYDPSSNFAGAASRWQRGYVYSSALSNKLQEQFEYDFSKKLSVIAGVSVEFLSSTPRTGLSPKPYEPSNPANQTDFYYIGAAGFAPYLDQNEPIAFNDSLTVKQELFNLSYQNYGSYAQVQWAPSSQIEFTGGLRYDYNTRYGGTVNPRFGIVFKPNKKWRAKLLYGESFLAPSPTKSFSQEGSFYDYDAQQGLVKADYFKVANPELAPEKLRSAEASVSYYLLANLSVAANGFYTLVEDLINERAASTIVNPSVSGQSILAATVGTSANEGDSEIYGGTVRCNYLLKLPGAIAMRFYGAYSYIDGTTFGGPLLFTAKHTVKSGVDIMHKKWSIAPRLRYRSATKTVVYDGADGTAFDSPFFTVLDLMATYHLIQKKDTDLSVFLRVNNVTNLRYYNVNVGAGDGLPLTPQDPIRLLSGVTYMF